MNKELEESKQILENVKDSIDWDCKENVEVRNAISTVLNYIENSIPKEKVEEKIKELVNTKGDFATYIATSERIKVLEELLEGK